MSEGITATVPPLWSDERIAKEVRALALGYKAHHTLRDMRNGYEAERIQLLVRIAELERQVERAKKEIQ